MRKAIMYLLLALGITLGVLFVGGAIGGFIVGFVDGWNGAKNGTSSSVQYGTIAAVVMVVLWTVAMQWTFIRNRFASYTLGLIPKNRLWTVTLMAFFAFAGINMLEMVIYHPLVDGNPESLENWQWIMEHRWLTIILLIPADITYMLVLYGAIFREIVEWKPNVDPNLLPTSFSVVVLIPMFVLIFFIDSDLTRSLIPSFMSIQLACMIYLCTRSIVPLLIGSTLADVLSIAFFDANLGGWYFIPACVLMLVGAWGIWKATETYRPIE